MVVGSDSTSSTGDVTRREGTEAFGELLWKKQGFQGDF